MWPAMTSTSFYAGKTATSPQKSGLAKQLPKRQIQHTTYRDTYV